MALLTSFLIGASLLQMSFCLRTQFIVFDVNGNVIGCEENGITYNVYEEMPGEDCQDCFCGQDLEKVCRDKRLYCPTKLRCVDAEYDEDTCCYTCKNGENCWLDGRIVSACGDIPKRTGDPYCSGRCRCPPHEEFDSDTQAHCVIQCS